MTSLAMALANTIKASAASQMPTRNTTVCNDELVEFVLYAEHTFESHTAVAVDCNAIKSE